MKGLNSYPDDELSRQGYGKGAAAPQIARAIDRAAVRFGDPSDDGQAEPEAAILAVARLSGAVEALENAGRVAGRDADSGIGDAQLHARGAGFQRGRHLAAGRCVADGVIEQVDHQAAQQLLVAGELQVVARAGTLA